MKTPSGRTPPQGATGRATPGEQGLGLMATMAAGAPVSEVYEAQPVRKSKAGLIFGAAALVAVAGGVVVFLMTRGGNTSAEPSQNPKAIAAATVPDTGPRPEPGKPDGVVTPPAQPDVVAPPPVAPAPANVVIEISGTPEGTEVLVGEKVVGTAPGRIELPRGDEAVMLTFKKSGYKPREQTITPAKDGFISVELSKAPRKPDRDKKDRKKDDKDSIEDPFK